VTIEELDSLSGEAAAEAFGRCCGSAKWIEAMVSHRPYRAAERLFAAAEQAAEGLGESDWKEAFSHHPQIGDIETLRGKFAPKTRDWSEGEQKGAGGAEEAVLVRLKEKNDEYLGRFGYIFIVCATGKTAAEMLDILEARLPNDPITELRAASAEQRKITRLRLQKLLGGPS